MLYEAGFMYCIVTVPNVPDIFLLDVVFSNMCPLHTMYVYVG
jgi:hypothetical protein